MLDPTGTLVVFSRNAVGGRQLFRVGVGGGTPVQLTTGSGDNMNPAFSPAGDRIAFDSARSGSKDRDIYTAPFSPGATSLNATNLTNAAGFDLIPAWSRNGIVAFTSNRTGNFEIWKMPAAGGTATQLTNDRKRDIDPSFSPDGNTIAFSSNRRAPEPGGAQEIYTIATNGPATTLTRVTSLEEGDRAPLWLDPIRIVFSSRSLNGLAIVSPTGGTPTKIPNTTKDDRTPG